MRYEFSLASELSSTGAAAFPELTVRPRPGGGTTLYGPVTDRAALKGLLARFENLGLSILEMRQLPD